MPQEEGNRFDLDQVLLMATIGSEEDIMSWYLDIKCSNHITRNRKSLIDLNPCMRNSVKFAHNSSIVAEGIGKVMITRKDGKVAYMNDVYTSQA